jgi:hypothetical protein
MRDEAQEDAAEEVPTSADHEPDPSLDLLINAAKRTNSTPLPPGDICRVMSKNSKHSVNTTCIEYKDTRYPATKNTTVFHLPS